MRNTGARGRAEAQCATPRGAGGAGALGAGARRCNTAAWGCDTVGGPGHGTAPMRT